MIFQSLELSRQSFLESLRVRSYSMATLKSYGRSLTVFFRFIRGSGINDVREVSRQTVREYQLWLAKSDYATCSVQSHLQTIKRFYEHLERTDTILINPCGSLVMPRLGKKLPENVLTKEEAKQLLNAPNTQTRIGIRNKAIIELFYSTGIRLGEMTRLAVLDVDFLNGFLRVNKGKCSKDRVVPMGNRAIHWVREYLRRVRLEWSRGQKEERAMWLSYGGSHRPIKSQAIELMIKNYARAIGFQKPVTPHTWRHTCATHMVAGGANVIYVQKLLGHRSLKTTNIYTRVSLPEVKNAHQKKHPAARRKGGRAHAVTPELRRDNKDRLALYRRRKDAMG